MEQALEPFFYIIQFLAQEQYGAKGKWMCSLLEYTKNGTQSGKGMAKSTRGNGDKSYGEFRKLDKRVSESSQELKMIENIPKSNDKLMDDITVKHQ